LPGLTALPFSFIFNLVAGRPHEAAS